MSISQVIAGFGATNVNAAPKIKTEQQISDAVGEVPINIANNNEFQNVLRSTPYVVNENSEHSSDYRTISTTYENGSSLNIHIDSGNGGQGANNTFNVFGTSFETLTKYNEVGSFSYNEQNEGQTSKYTGYFDNTYNGGQSYGRLSGFSVDKDDDGNTEKEFSYDYNNYLKEANYDVDDDGVVDYSVEYDRQQHKTSEKFDLDSDGLSDIEKTYDEDGNLVQILEKAEDGQYTTYYENGDAVRTEIDDDFDGKVEYERIYNEDGTYKEKDRRGFLERIFG